MSGERLKTVKIMKKAIKILIAYVSVVAPVFIICLSLIFTGNVSINICGFAVDTYENLYIGTDSGIEKYQNGALVKMIDPKTSRGYAFTVQADNTILLSTASKVYTMDLDGNVIDECEDIDTKTFNELRREKNKFTAADASVYSMKNTLGRTKIVSDGGEIIYQLPTTDYIVKIAFSLATLSAFIFVPIIVYKWRKEEI